MSQKVDLKKSTPRYKHILGWPLTVEDLEQLDSDTYMNLCKLKDLDDVEVVFRACMLSSAAINYV